MLAVVFGFDLGTGVRLVSGDKLCVGTLVLASVATITLLAGIPTVHALRGWFWKPLPKSLEVEVLLAGALGVAALLSWAFWMRARFVASVGALVLIAVSQQFTFALAEGRGIAGLRDRAAYTGHGEYGRVASTGITVGGVLRDYEGLVEQSQLPYCAVKPPGQLLTYVISASLADLLVAPGLLERSPLPAVLTDQHRRLLELMAWSWPWLAALGLVPIAALARCLLADQWFWPVAWFALSAPFALVTLHLDQVLFPGLAASLIWAGWVGRYALAGVLAWLSAFVSFGLLPAVVLAALLAVCNMPRGQRWSRGLWAALWFGAAFVAFAAVHCGLTGYDPLLRYQRAIAAHEQWKHWEATLSHSLAAARMNLIEFVWWANPAFLVPAAVMAVGIVRRWRARGSTAIDAVTIAFVVVLGLVAGLGRTWAETARLWLFLLPLALVCVAPPLLQRGNAACAIVAAVQWIWVFAIKTTQDFR